MTFRGVLQIAALLFPMCMAFAGDSQAPMLNIVIVEGEGAINNVKQRTSRETIVEVQDENHKPVAGAAVVFLLPGDGPGGAFVGGAKSATLTTDAAGRATMPRLQPNQPGSFQIRVNASSQGRTATATIGQSNVAGAAAAGAGGAAAGISGKTIAIIVAVAAAGAAGAAVGLTRGKNNNNTPPTVITPTGTISVGSGATLGPPQ
jgi:hypothetical protein